MSTTLPPAVDLAVLHALCRSPAWSGAVDVATVRRIVRDQLDEPEVHGGQCAVNLSPLYRYIALAAGEPGVAARCVREIADGLLSAGLPSAVPELELKRGDLEVTKPERRRVMAPAKDRLPLIGFACFVALIAGCMFLSGG